MKQRTVNTLSLVVAGILGLTGESFLLLPTRVKLITEHLPVPALGAIFILAALTEGMSLFISAKTRERRILQLFSLVMLALLGVMYLQTRLYIEALLLFGIVAASLFVGARSPGSARQQRRMVLALMSAANTATALLVLFLPTWLAGPSYPLLWPYRYGLAGAFLLSVCAGIVVLFRQSLMARWLLSRSLALPWALWIVFYIVHFSLPHLIVPILMAALILFGDAIPWNKFVLPEGDMVGKRLMSVGYIALFLALGFLSVLLDLLDQFLLHSNLPTTDLLIREGAFVFYAVLTCLMAYGIAMIAMTINGLMTSDTTASAEPITSPTGTSWSDRVARYLKPFSLTREGLSARLEAQADQINALTYQLAHEKRRSEQLTLLAELSQQLEAQLDQPVAAQLTLNTIERAIECSYACLYVHEPERREYVALASAGRMVRQTLPGNRQSITRGVLGRVTRLRKTQVIYDTRLEPDEYGREGEDGKVLSCIVVPLIFAGHIKGAIEIQSDRSNTFGSSDVAIAEAMATELVRAWERSNYHYRLMDLIQAGISLSTMIEPEATVQEIATIAKQTLEARFTYVSLLSDREENLTQAAHAGDAPRLLSSLEREAAGDPILKASRNAAQPFRVRDIRKYSPHSQIEIDHNGLRSLLVVPIRLHRLNIGCILAFGKQKEAFFTENDESLASLLASQAAAAIESVWLQQELRATLRTTRLLYELSYHIIESEELSDAARHIAGMAHRLAGATRTGIVLFKPDRQIETELEVDAEGTRSSSQHPMEIIDKVMRSGRVIYESIDRSTSRVCLPIETPRRKYGALWLTVPETRGYKSGSPADLQTLTNQAALALERAILMVESRQQAKEIEAAYRELELAYDRTLAGLMSALDARDRETEGHSMRVSHLAVQLGVALGLSAPQLKALQRGSLLHDIGKIGISDAILNKPGPLTELEWEQMRLHPDIGARIIEGIPFLQETLPVIRYHQERWDGSGYPVRLKGTGIPRLARIFAVVDAYDALTSDRPYRQRISTEAALAYLREQAGILFDAEIVTAFVQLISEGEAPALIAK